MNFLFSQIPLWLYGSPTIHWRPVTDHQDFILLSVIPTHRLLIHLGLVILNNLKWCLRSRSCIIYINLLLLFIDYHCNNNEHKRKASKLPEKVTSIEIERNAINVYIDHPYALKEISHSSHQSLVPEGALKCDECKRFFKSGRFLQRHLQYCGKEPAFSCPICNYRAARKQTLQQHLLCVHKINPSQLADYGVGNINRLMIIQFLNLLVIFFSISIIIKSPANI